MTQTQSFELETPNTNLSTTSAGKLHRILTSFASNTASQHRRFAQALITLASPSAQVAQSRSGPPSSNQL